MSIISGSGFTPVFYLNVTETGCFRRVTIIARPSFGNTPWTLDKENDATYLGKLSYKGFEVQVRISIVENVLAMTLDSVTETGCGGDCEDLGEKPVLRWLVSLRRSITYKLTLQVRDSLQ